MTPTRLKAYLALIALAVIWGAALPVVKPALSYITPAQFLLLRYALSALFLLPLISPLYQSFTHDSPQELTFAVYGGLLSALSLLLLYTGLELSSALETSLITNIRPVLLILLGIALLKEQEENHEWFGLALSFLGSLVILFTPSLTTTDASVALLGNTLVFAFILFDVLSTMLIKIKCPHLPRLTITAINILTGVPIFLFYSYLTGEPLTFSQSTHPSVLLSVGYMAMLGTILGFTLLYYGYKHIEASEATLFSYLQPLVYIPLATLWLKEPLYPIQIFGLVMILIGVIIAQHRPHPSTLKSG